MIGASPVSEDGLLSVGHPEQAERHYADEHEQVLLDVVAFQASWDMRRFGACVNSLPELWED